MHVERVDAHAFGPFSGETLELGPGCNVVHGPNESGKSSWHAALTTAVGGRRRTRGGQTGAERRFAERHRPWAGARWAVSARIHLADGRVVTVLQDLDEPARCQAHDQSGRRVLEEIFTDGMPDATRWLGLDRDAFRACASVGQADIARVTGDAEALQRYLQQAASTRKAESTAGAALDRLRSFKSEAVGADRRNAVKPLRRARDRAEAATDGLHHATTSHDALIAETERSARFTTEARRATLERRAAEALEAEARATRLERETARIADLTARCPEPPPAIDSDDELAGQVRTALLDWERSPEEPTPPSPTSAELREQLAEPEAVTGDTTIHTSVGDALRAFEEAREAFVLHREATPPVPSIPGGTEPVELRALAQRLREEPPPAAPPAPETRPSTRAPLVSAAIGLVVAGVLAVAGQPLVGGLVAAVGLVVAALLSVRKPEAVPVAASAPISPLRARLADLGLRPDPDELQGLADAADRHQAWRERGAALREQVNRAGAAVERAIEARIGPPTAPSTSLRDRFAEYQGSCRAEAERVQAEATERHRLERALDHAVAEEERASEARKRRADASSALDVAAAAARVGGADDEARAAALVAWQETRRDRLEAMELRRKDWDQLLTLGGGRSLDEWTAEATTARAHADRLAADLDADLLERVRSERVPTAERIVAERTALDCAQEARAALEVKQAHAPSVSEATEVVAAADQELDRVLGLDSVLTTTIACLEQAQDRLYRSLAPVLADRLREVLPAVSAGRYDEVTVDPETLEVQVRLADGTLRPAGLLSHGTAEQVYLLLRLAMAERLVTGDERCPLVLDDVTVHCDPQRTEAILDLVARLAEDRQVVVFTQEDAVVDWARRTLTGDRHRVIALDRPAVPA